MAQERNSGEFHRADPAWRRTMMVVLVLTAVFGIAALVLLNLWLSRQGVRLSRGDLAGFERSLHQVLAIICLALGAAAAVFSAWLFGVSAATRAERRWPPSQMRTSSDVRIRYLTSADALVTQMRGGAYGLALLALALFAWGGWLLRTL